MLKVVKICLILVHVQPFVTVLFIMLTFKKECFFDDFEKYVLSGANDKAGTGTGRNS